MSYILTHESLGSSAHLLSNALSLPIRWRAQPGEPPTVRWGNSLGISSDDTQFNNPHTISACTRARFSEVCDMPHVTLYKGIPNCYPVVVRKLLNSSGGNGIVVVRNLQEWEPYKDYHWSYWHVFEFELGVHILGGKIARIFKKIWDGSSEEEETFPIRNSARGYRFSLRGEGNYPKLCPFIEEFYSKFPINMARLDIGWDSVDKTYRIIEVNTAPGLTDNSNTAKAYVSYLKEALRR